jgi:hypothetical protein
LFFIVSLLVGIPGLVMAYYMRHAVDATAEVKKVE